MQEYRRKKEEEEMRSYSNIMDERKMKANTENFADYEDEKSNVNAFEEDFM